MFKLNNIMDLDSSIKFIENCFNDCNENIKNDMKNILKKKSPKISLKVSLDSNIIVRCLSINEIEISIALFRELEAFYKVVLSEENEGYYKSISDDKNYCPSTASLYISLLMSISIKIILFHELGHIYNGHIQYLQNNSTNKIIDFSENLQSSIENTVNDVPLDEMIIKALEWNADDFSATRIIARYCHESVIESINNGNNKIIHSNQHMFLLVLESTVILYSLLGLGNNNRKEDFKHPPLRLRLISTISTQIFSYNIFNKEKIDLSNDLINLIIKLENMVNSYCNKTKPSIYKTSNNLNELMKESQGINKKIEDYYLENLTEILKPYAILSVLTPNK